MKRMIVTGSRHWKNVDAMRDMLLLMAERRQWIRWVAGRLEHRAQITIVHGDARGADRIADMIAMQLGWEVERFPADWARLGRAAGPERNHRMVQAGADMCVAFPMKGSRGTWDCVRQAFDAGIEIQLCQVGRLW